MRIHHLSCGSMCPFGGRLISGEGPLLAAAELVTHCLLIEAPDALALVDTGFGSADVASPRRLGQPFRALVRPRLEEGSTAAAQIRAMGLDPADVRHVFLTHLDLDHAGGLGDFPNAQVHVLAAEKVAFERPLLRERGRYVRAQAEHGPRWVTYEPGGDDWFGFESVRAVGELADEVALVPLPGHSRGHTAVAVRDGDGWLLHCGDAYFHRGEVATPPHCPPVLRWYAGFLAADDAARRQNLERLRELARDHGDEVRLFCSHDPVELARLRTGT